MKSAIFGVIALIALVVGGIWAGSELKEERVREERYQSEVALVAELGRCMATKATASARAQLARLVVHPYEPVATSRTGGPMSCQDARSRGFPCLGSGEDEAFYVRFPHLFSPQQSLPMQALSALAEACEAPPGAADRWRTGLVRAMEDADAKMRRAVASLQTQHEDILRRVEEASVAEMQERARRQREQSQWAVKQ